MKINNKKTQAILMSRLFIFFILLPSITNSQILLSSEEAIAIALKENYGIQIADLQATAEAMQVYKSNAGFGPTVDLNGSLGLTGNYINQSFVDGRKLNRFGRVYNPNINISVAMTLYDGGEMQAIYDQLELTSELTQLQGKITIQNTVVQVMQTYYDIVRHKKTVDYLNAIIQYYDERLKITEERWKVGQGSKIDFLQSQTDKNAQLSSLVTAKNNLKNAKVLMNGLLNRSPSLDFEVDVTNTTPIAYELSELLTIAQDQNREVLILQKSLELSKKEEVEITATRKPQVNLGGSIGYNYNNTNAGFLLSNQTFFATAGVTATWRLYDGHDRKNQIAIAEVNTHIIEKQQEQLDAQIENDLTFAYNRYTADQELLAFEEANKSIADENLSISLKKFRLGASTILELNEAQESYDTALNRLVEAQYNVKLSELELLRLSGIL